MPILHTSTLPDGARFAPGRADKVVNFVERCAVHTKSEWAGGAFELAPWQAGSAVKDPVSGLWRLDGIVRPLFGAVRYDEMYKKWVRQFTMAWIEVARKNGKSELMAALGLYLLMADGEWSGEVYGAASDKDQAAMVFNVARDMIKLSPFLKKLQKRGDLEIIDSRKTIVYTPTLSTYRVVSADAAGNLGANPSAILFDEVLAQPDERLWDYLRQGFGTRPQPLHIGVTTAGPDRESFAYREHEFGVQVAQEPNLDPKRFVYMAYVDEHEDWENQEAWPEANPGWGDFLNPQTIRDEYIEIKNKGDLSQVAHFRIFRLNQWGTAKNRWLDLSVWDESEGTVAAELPEDLNLADHWCYGGLDLADTTDFVAWVLIFKVGDSIIIKPRFWITRQAAEKYHKRMFPTILGWQADGFVTIVDSDAHDYEAIKNQIMTDIETYKFAAIGYDQYQAPAIVNAIESRTDVECIKIPQTTVRMNPGSKELTRRMGLRELYAEFNPVLRWMADNAAYKQDNDKNVKPDKVKSSESIDGITALVNGLCVMVGLPEPAVPNFHMFDDSCPECDSPIAEPGMCIFCGARWG